MVSTVGKRTGLERPLYSKGREGSQDNLEAPRLWVGAGDEQPSRSLGMNEELRLYHSELRQCKLLAQDGLVAVASVTLLILWLIWLQGRWSYLVSFLFWAELFPPKIHMFKSQPPVPQDETVFREKVFELKWGCYGEGSSNMINVLIRQRDTRGPHAQRDDHVKRQQDCGRLQVKDRGFRGIQPCWHLDFELPVSKLWDKKFMLPASLWSLVMAALAKP